MNMHNVIQLERISEMSVFTVSRIILAKLKIINLDVGLQTILFQPSQSFKGIIYTDPCVSEFSKLHQMHF